MMIMMTVMTTTVMMTVTTIDIDDDDDGGGRDDDINYVYCITGDRWKDTRLSLYALSCSGRPVTVTVGFWVLSIDSMDVMNMVGNFDNRPSQHREDV